MGGVHIHLHIGDGISASAHPASDDGADVRHVVLNPSQLLAAVAPAQDVPPMRSVTPAESAALTA